MKIWDFFEHLNDIMYAADMDTHELIYLNRAGREAYGIQSLEELKGRKCYEILQHESRPCAMCTNNELKETYFKEWTYFNPILNQYLNLKDTMINIDGRRCRIEFAFKTFSDDQQLTRINNYQRIEAMANEGIRIALQASSPDQTIEILLEYIGKTLQGERSYIFERNANGNDDNTYEWTAVGVTPEKDNLQDLPAEVCQNWYQRFHQNQTIQIADLEEIKETDPLQYENLKRQNIQSIAVVPLYDNDKVVGFYGVDNPPSKYLEYATNMLLTMGYFMSSSLKMRDLFGQLQRMSHKDQLTNLDNRYSLIEYKERINASDSLGIIFCDITGLKIVNDNEGHGAGDRLILRASECLKHIYNGYHIFRTGGDELLVLCKGISEEEFNRLNLLLKEDMKQSMVNMAIGTVWTPACTQDIDSMINEAEQNMYIDKAEYYRITGKDRRV